MPDWRQRPFRAGLSGQSSPRRSHFSARTTPTATSLPPIRGASEDEAPAPAGRDDLDKTSSSAPPTTHGEDADASPTSSEQEEQVERDLGEMLADVERERDEYLGLARRTKADFENYRKRVAGETALAEKRGRADLARQLLPVLDNLERALAAAEGAADEGGTPKPGGGAEQGSLLEGVRLVSEELARVLERSGIESYEPAGEPFDPHSHEAMMTRPAPAKDAGKVVEVLEKGYRLDGQVLRPARVVVGAGEQHEGTESGAQPDEQERDDAEGTA